MQLSEKRTFCCSFIAFMESTLNLQHFQQTKKKKNKKIIEHHSLIFFEIIDSERFSYSNV